MSDTMWLGRVYNLTGAVCAMTLAGCASPDEQRIRASGDAVEDVKPASGSAIDAAAFQGQWIITAFDGAKAVPSEFESSETIRPSLTFSAHSYSGTAGCNGLGGIGVLNGNRYYTGPGPQTLIGCRPRTSKQEDVFSDVLRASPEITIVAEDRIELAGGGHRLSLTRDDQSPERKLYSYRQPEAATVTILAIDGERALTGAIRLELSGMEWRLQEPCSTLTGQWSQPNWEIRTARMIVPAAGCSTPEQSKRIKALFSGPTRHSTGPNGEFVLGGNDHWINGQLER